MATSRELPAMTVSEGPLAATALALIEDIRKLFRPLR